MIEIVSGLVRWDEAQPEVTERYLASWLCVHARADGLPQREYDAICASYLAELRQYIYGQSGQDPPIAAPSVLGETLQEGEDYGD